MKFPFACELELESDQKQNQQLLPSDPFLQFQLMKRTKKKNPKRNNTVVDGNWAAAAAAAPSLLWKTFHPREGCVKPDTREKKKSPKVENCGRMETDVVFATIKTGRLGAQRPAAV